MALILGSSLEASAVTRGGDPCRREFRANNTHFDESIDLSTINPDLDTFACCTERPKTWAALCEEQGGILRASELKCSRSEFSGFAFVCQSKAKPAGSGPKVAGGCEQDQDPLAAVEEQVETISQSGVDQLAPLSADDAFQLLSARKQAKAEKAKSDDKDKEKPKAGPKGKYTVTRTMTGTASHYGRGDGYWGRRTASGVIHRRGQMTAAMRAPVPFGTKVRVTDLRTGKSIIVTITDRGPFTKVRGRYNRLIDLNSSAADRLSVGRAGTGPVKLEFLKAN